MYSNTHTHSKNKKIYGHKLVNDIYIYIYMHVISELFEYPSE
jgi:hypothetical protein